VGRPDDLDVTKRVTKRKVAAVSRRLGVCPACGAVLEKPGYGTGSIVDGNFCSLACIADYWYGER